MSLRGIGIITALALFASVGNPHQFRNGRQFAAWLGLAPKQYGAGGKVTLGSISKRGSTYLRTLLIHGARTLMRWLNKHDDAFSQWAKQLIARRGKHKAIVAMANKTARHVWVAMAKGIEYVPSCHLAI
jgi:transposase